MAKPKFNPDVINNRESSTNLKPFDFMQPMKASSEPVSASPEPTAAAPRESTPQKMESKAKATPKAKTTPPQRSVATDDVPMPRLRKTDARVVTVYRSPIDLDDRLRRFVNEQSTFIQDTCVLAMDEFLKRRGY